MPSYLNPRWIYHMREIHHDHHRILAMCCADGIRYEMGMIGDALRMKNPSNRLGLAERKSWKISEVVTYGTSRYITLNDIRAIASVLGDDRAMLADALTAFLEDYEAGATDYERPNPPRWFNGADKPGQGKQTPLSWHNPLARNDQWAFLRFTRTFGPRQERALRMDIMG